MKNNIKMSSADYTYRITNGVISIIDLDQGGVSVTNDIENVIAEIVYKENIDPIKYKIIYRDSAGFWDGYRFLEEEFVHIGVKSEKETLESKFIKD